MLSLHAEDSCSAHKSSFYSYPETLFFPCLPICCLYILSTLLSVFLSVCASIFAACSSECLKFEICLLSVCPLVFLKGHSREYWMIYRGPGLLAVVWLPCTPSPVSNLSLFLSLPRCPQSSLLLGEVGWEGWARSWIIRRRESLAFYKSFNTLWDTASIQS